MHLFINQMKLQQTDNLTTLISFKSLLLMFFLLAGILATAQTPRAAQSPPMGWNSYHAFGASVKENEVLENAGFMETHLKNFGWQYVVIDYCWYFPYPAALNNPAQGEGFTPGFTMDRFGRLYPSEDRFPSSANNKGFKSLADNIHKKGLRFGIQIMRGIPRQAVAANTQIKGSSYHARDIADTNSICTWLNHMYGIDMDKQGAQEYYNSLFELYASWGVDFVKVDDIVSPFREKEIAAIRKAITHCGRPMVLSIASGETPLAKASLAAEYADTWRISNDFRDNWKSLQQMFALLNKWEGYIGPGHFPDADMLPVGMLSRRGPGEEPRKSEFTRTELVTLMTLWSIARSPLMYGGDLSMLRPFELSLLQNKEVLKVNQNSVGNRQLFRVDDQVAWTSDDPETGEMYVAVFNLGESTQLISLDLKDLGFEDNCQVTDLWTGDQLGSFRAFMRPEVLPHGARLLRLSDK